MAKKARNRTADYAVYLAVRLCIAAIQMVSPRIAYACADFLGWAVYKLAKRRREVALENVRAAFPELATNPAGADRLVRDMFQHFARALIELALFPRKVRRSTVDRYLLVDARGLGLMHEKRPALIATAHFGNWEMAGVWFGLAGFRTYAIARVLDNPYLERLVLKFRQLNGQTIFDKNGEYDKICAALQAGGKMATVADQDAGPGGLFVDFFGRPASTHKAVALLAMKYDALILVAGTPRVNRADYAPRAGVSADDPMYPMFYSLMLLDVIDPREFTGRRAETVRAITERFTAALEGCIRKYPEQYFWLHRRWKHQPPAKREKDKPAEDKAA